MVTTKNKVSPKVVVTAIVIVLVVVASLVMAAILPMFNLGGNAYSGSASTGTMGYCVDGYNTNTASGSYQAKSTCGQTPKTFKGKSFPGYLMFCDGVVGETTDKGGDAFCNCGNAADPDKAMAPHVAEAQSSRDSYNNNFNNGEWTESDMIDEFQNKVAEVVNCSCGVIASDKAAVVSEVNGGKITETDGVLYTMQFGLGKVSGSHKLLEEFAKLMNKMTSYNKSTKSCETESFPTTCVVSSSYSSNRDNPNSRHLYGEAIDISCKVPVGENIECIGDTLKALNLIKKYNTGFDIIQECTQSEKNKCGAGSNQVIHLDLGDPGRRGNDPGKHCEWVGCNFGKEDCLPPNN